MKKKFLRKISLSLCITMILALLPSVAFAESNGSVSITASNRNITAGDTVSFKLSNDINKNVAYYLMHINGNDDITIPCEDNITEYTYTFNDPGTYNIKVDAYGTVEGEDRYECVAHLNVKSDFNYSFYTSYVDYIKINVDPRKDDLPKIIDDLPDSICHDPNEYSSLDYLKMNVYVPYGSSGTWDLYERKHGENTDVKIKSGTIYTSYGSDSEDISTYISYSDEAIGNSYYFVIHISNTSIGVDETLYSNRCNYYVLPKQPSLKITSDIDSTYPENGTKVTLTATATCSETDNSLSYQWYSGVTDDFNKAKIISGATDPILKTKLSWDSSTKEEYQRIYFFCKVTNSNDKGSSYITDSFYYTLQKPIISKPKITISASNNDVTTGSAIYITANGSTADKGKLTYQWYSNSTNNFESAKKIKGATKTTYEAIAPDSKCTLYYFCEVTSTLNGLISTNFAYTSINVSDPDPMDNFQQKESYSNGKFLDVKSNDWFFDGVKQSFELGLMKGSTDNYFSPNKTITLAESITLAARLHSIINNNSYNFNTASVPWYKCYEDYCLQNGIIKPGEFSNLNNTATRADFAVIMSRAFPDSALVVKNNVENESIPDVDTSKAYSAAVYKLYRAGILSGSDSKGSFNPDSSIKRSEVSTLITRMAKPQKRANIKLEAQNNYIEVYSLDGRHVKIRPYKLKAQQSVGWYLYPDYIDKIANKKYTAGDREGAVEEYETAMETVGTSNKSYYYFKNKRDNMCQKWSKEIKSPIAIVSYAVGSSYGYPDAIIRIRNLTPKTIIDLDVRFTCYDGYWKQTSDYYGNDGSYYGYLESGSTFTSYECSFIHWTLYSNERTKHIGNVKVKNVAYSDGSSWK